jgi:hypothetical protein
MFSKRLERDIRIGPVSLDDLAVLLMSFRLSRILAESPPAMIAVER